MTENEEVERYQKLLADWKPAPPAKKPMSRAATVPPTSYAASQFASSFKGSSSGSGKAVAESASYSPGAILRLNQREIVIYRRPAPEKEYHLVMVLHPNGAVKVQGVVLEGHEVEELGSLPPAWLERLQNEMRWERDLIVFHCYRYEDVAKIPAFDGSEEIREDDQPVTQTREAEQTPLREPKPEKPNGSLRRGQRLQIKFGPNTWEAVYWGKDDQGQVIAHKTYERWSLMHLDLKRFMNGLVVESDADQELVQEIEENLVTA